MSHGKRQSAKEWQPVLDPPEVLVVRLLSEMIRDELQLSAREEQASDHGYWSCDTTDAHKRARLHKAKATALARMRERFEAVTMANEIEQESE